MGESGKQLIRKKAVIDQIYIKNKLLPTTNRKIMDEKNSNFKHNSCNCIVIVIVIPVNVGGNRILAQVNDIFRGLKELN